MSDSGSRSITGSAAGRWRSDHGAVTTACRLTMLTTGAGSRDATTRSAVRGPLVGASGLVCARSFWIFALLVRAAAPFMVMTFSVAGTVSESRSTMRALAGTTARRRRRSDSK